MINVEINGKLVGQCESAGKASSPLFKDVIEPWIEIRGFIASSPSLTDDQQVVLEWLKESCNADDYTTPMLAIYKLYSSQQMVPNLVFLTTEKQFQVLAVFAEWGLKEDNQ